MHSYRFLFAPSAAPGNGTGHLRRAVCWASELPRDSFKIYIRASHWREEFARMAAAYRVRTTSFLFDEREINASDWDFVLLDRRATTKAEFLWWSRTGLQLIGLDEGGPCRQLFSYLIDTFPIPRRFGPANVYDPAYLSLPNERRPAPSGRDARFDNILISFGGEDPAGLTEKCSRWLIQSGGCEPSALTVVLGPLFGPRELPEGVKTLHAPADLAGQLHRYDLVCTSFGLTAYEAAYAGCGVILFNPSSYHRRLGHLAGFPLVGVRRINARRFSHLLHHPSEVLAAAGRAAPAEKRSPASLLGRLRAPEVRDCPGCGRLTAEAVLRCAERSFFRCRQCGLLYQIDFFSPQQRYTQDYFFEEYRSQYGRSYLEDFAAIKQISRRRLALIRRILAPRSPGPFGSTSFESAPGGRLLDVGCAYGPFLAAAAEAGFQPEGLEPVSSAAQYVRSQLDIPVRNLAFEDFETENRYDVISMWFVIEHFVRVDEVLSKAGSLLKMGGLLAFSTPSSTGISARKSLKGFLRRSPRDHHSIWSPAVARKVLLQFGFRVKKIVITGHHPERFPLIGPRLAAARQKGASGLQDFAWALLLRLSMFFGLGDTFEVYAEKKGQTQRGAAPGASEHTGEQDG